MSRRPRIVAVNWTPSRDLSLDGRGMFLRRSQLKLHGKLKSLQHCLTRAQRSLFKCLDNSQRYSYQLLVVTLFSIKNTNLQVNFYFEAICVSSGEHQHPQPDLYSDKNSSSVKCSLVVAVSQRLVIICSLRGKMEDCIIRYKFSCKRLRGGR